MLSFIFDTKIDVVRSASQALTIYNYDNPIVGYYYKTKSLEQEVW